jgi:hypothetical protein
MYQKLDVGGIGVFYRQTGPKEAPTILLLHGFPSASHTFRDLIPQLADRFHLIVPICRRLASPTCRRAAPSRAPNAGRGYCARRPSDAIDRR